MQEDAVTLLGWIENAPLVAFDSYDSYVVLLLLTIPSYIDYPFVIR